MFGVPCRIVVFRVLGQKSRPINGVMPQKRQSGRCFSRALPICHYHRPLYSAEIVLILSFLMSMTAHDIDMSERYGKRYVQLPILWQ